MNLSEPQKRVIRHVNRVRTTLLAGGAIRSGKSYACALALVVWALKSRNNHDGAIVGNSVESIMRNLGFDVLEMATDMGAVASLDKQFGTRIVINGRNIWIIGATDAKARRRIQGATLGALLVDEAALLPKEFFLQAWGRLSVSNAKCWLTYNPEGPAHWLKRLVVDRLEDFDAELVQFKMHDNPTLDEQVMKRYDSSFTGHFHARMIGGEWAGASGLIFPDWSENDGQPHTGAGVSYRGALDWGVSGVLAALVASVKGDSVRVIGELRHETDRDGVWSESQAVAALGAFFNAHPHSRMHVYCDPSTPQSVQRLLRLQGGLRVIPANNDILNGLSRTAEALASGKVSIYRDGCPGLVKEMGSYQWSDAKTEQGIDAPVKADDHSCDALRYMVHSVGWTQGQLRPTTVAKAMSGGLERRQRRDGPLET